MINISYINSNNETNFISKNIDETTYIFLNSKFLSYNSNNTNNKGNLSISIQSTNNINDYMFLKIIEENTICLLEKNSLNYGFITSKTTHQYYYTEVLEGEEGELMLHNKRNYGILYAKIVDKSIEDKTYLYDKSNYPNGTNYENNELEYDQHYLQLKFNSVNTSHCTNGCYLLITYEQIKSEEEFPLVGYEFTILSRTWNQSDYIPSIIYIPFSEYIISCFGKRAAREHYYSIYIPDDAENIIIQLEGYYFDAFYEIGKKKINTLKESTDRLGTKEIQNVIIFNNTFTKKIKNKGGIISLAFRPKTYFSSIISSYYFRVLYKKEKETKNEKKYYLPMDSNLGNLCIPEKKDNFSLDPDYYCYLKLKNDFNESNLNFSVCSTNQNEFAKINVSIIFNNNTNDNDIDYFNYVYDQNKSDINYFLIEFKFKDNQTKTIISSFCDRVHEIYPQIYSVQMFYLNNFNKTHQFNLKNSFFGNYQYISGFSGIQGDKYSYLNFKGKQIYIHIINGIELNASTITNKFIYCLQLMPNLKRAEIIELKQGKPLVQLLDKKLFPYSYCYKIANKNYINININIKISDHYEYIIKNYTIKGYIINEDTINRIYNGEHVEIPTPYEGKYSDAFGMGFLQVNKRLEEKDLNFTQYLLVILDKNDNYEDKQDMTVLYIEIMVKEYDDKNGLFLPQNEYFIDTFDDAEKGIREFNQYSIFNPEGNTIQPVIEISSVSSNIKINFKNNISYSIEYSTGFQVYKIQNNLNETIFFDIINSGKKTNFMIIYYLNDTNDNHKFILKNNYRIDDDGKNQNIANISITFDDIEVKNLMEGGIIFFITGVLYEQNKNSLEQLNHTCFLYERKGAYANKTFSYFDNDAENVLKKWTLVYTDIPRDKNYIYDLRLQVIASIINDNSKEEYLVFTTKVDLQNIKLDSKKVPWYAWGIPVIVVVIILIIILTFFIIKYLKLKKKNTNLKQEIVSLAFSNEVQKNVLTKDMKISKNESDYESTFI